MTTIGPKSPCEATVTPDENGGLAVSLFIPTYEGGATFTLDVERDNDGDWRLFLPLWPDEAMDRVTKVTIPGGHYEVGDGILYLGAPDVECERKDGG